MTFLRPVQVGCVLAALFPQLLGCSSESTAANHGAEKGGQADSGTGASSLGAPLKLSITVPSVPPGKEGTQCIRAHLGNDGPLRVGKIHNKLSESSHHFILSAVDDAKLTDTPLFDCLPFRAALTGAPMTITQKSDDTVALPDGVAYSLPENQLMHLELHYINLTEKTEDITAETEIYPIQDTSKDIQEASFLLIGDLDINIPPKSKHSTGPVYQKLPDAFAGSNFYALTGHTHRFGTNVTVGTTASESAPVTPLYAPAQFDWSEPEVKRLSPTVSVPAGGGFSYQCDWDNPTDTVIKYGESALTEMCFFWAYYYPKQDSSRLLLKGVSSAYGDAGSTTLDGPPCALAGDKGNANGVGKYCTKGGSECGGAAPVCLADYARGGFGDFCTVTCKSDADCGAGASCVGQSTAVCIPTSCVGSLGTGAADAAAP
jgi:hypothetical protein